VKRGGRRGRWPPLCPPTSAVERRLLNGLLNEVCDRPRSAWFGASRDRFALRTQVPRRIADFRLTVAGIQAGGTPERTTGEHADLSGLAAEVARASWIDRCIAVPPASLYVDFKSERIDRVLAHEFAEARRFGLGRDLPLRGRRVDIEVCSPNTNKPLHLGHARNLFLGVAIGNLIEAAAGEVSLSTCLSDHGVHIASAVAAYLRCGGETTPASSGMKPDHFVGRFYALACVPANRVSLERDARELLGRLGEGQRDAVDAFTRVNAWAEAGFRETLAGVGVDFHAWFRESEHLAIVDEVIAQERLDGGVFVDAKGRTSASLEDARGETALVPLLRSDGTPLYVCHCLAWLIARRRRLGDVDEFVSLVGLEQEAEMARLAALLRRFGHDPSGRFHFLCHGLVYLPEGPRMSSRKGSAPTMDGTLEGLVEAFERAGAADADAGTFARTTLILHLLSKGNRRRLSFDLESCLREAGSVCLDVAQALRILERAEGARPDERGGGARDRRGTARSDSWRRRLLSFPYLLRRSIDELDPSILQRFLACLCGDLVALAKSDGRTPSELAGLREPAARVVRGVLAILNIRGPDADRLRDARPPSGQTRADGAARENSASNRGLVR